MADLIVANLSLQTLRDFLVEETKFLLNVSHDVERVKRDLRSIHALLMKADRDGRDSPSPTLENCVTQLKDLAYEAENVLETYAVEVASKKEGQSPTEKFQRWICIVCECWSSHQLGKKTRDIISRLADISNRLQTDLGQEGSSRSSPHEDEASLLRQTYAHEVEPHFVGMEEDIELLVSMVKDETRRQRVIEIYGMGGLGKTTLAQKIYNHRDLDISYARAWVCATQKFQAKAVLGKILKQLDSDAQIGSLDVGDLVVRIYRYLENRKCLIVIDDVWESEHWKIIKPAFPLSSMSCNVLLTTRSESIGNQECHRYKLEFLTEDQGWDLLKMIALPQDYAPVDSLEDTGREIVVKCGCLPLSISVIGGILLLKEEDTRLAEWKKVNMNIDSYLRHGGEGVTEDKRVTQVLDLSYDALPYYLKPCFLYLACFPEDEEIDTERLYLLWMAEGFISHEDKGRNESLRDVAGRYLTELAIRCMVQVKHKAEKKFHSCRLHDLMHDLCSSKAERENLLKRIEISTYQNDIPSSTGNSTKRFSIILDGTTNILGIPLEALKDLRSLILLAKAGYRFKRICFQDSTIYFDKSRYLRILVLEGCDFEDGKLPSKLGTLIHLRYLSLRDTNVGELPEFVCDIPYLQTLDLRAPGRAIKLPNVIWKMKRLRHLFLRDRIEVIGGEKLRLDGLVELETLQPIDSRTVQIVHICKLMNLRILHVKIHDMDSMTAVLHHMRSNISPSSETHLDVNSCDFSSEIGKNALRNVLISPSLVSLNIWRSNVSDGFPCYQQGMCRKLVNLVLIDYYVQGDMMEELGKYPALQTLTLENGIIGKPEIICRPNSFPQLKSLILYEVHNLRKWEVEKTAMSKLTELWIEGCKNLVKVPDGLRFISTLQKLTITQMPQEFKDRVRGQDFGSISHIPSTTIR